MNITTRAQIASSIAGSIAVGKVSCAPRGWSIAAPYAAMDLPYTLHPTPFTLHPTPYTLNPTPYTHTLHPTPYTLQPKP